MGMEHYTKVRDLGGTNGAFLARDRQQPDRLVVIKRLADGTQGIEELNASLRLRHPHIVRFLESFVYNCGLFVVMSYEPGGDLDRLFHYLMQSHRTPTTHTLLLWFVQLLEALVYCHDNHVIHRDIKPSNILVSEDTKVLYLGDFGSAKTLNTSNVTSTFVGSPMWISPEVLLGTTYSYAADVWSMGCVFYEMATLRKPFSAPSFAHLVQQITWGHITPLPSHVAEEVKSIIHSMLVLDPAQRVTAKAVLEVARDALGRARELRQASPSPIRPPPMSSKSSATPFPPRPASPPEVVAHQPRQIPPPPSQPHSSCPSAGTTVPREEGLTQMAAPPPSSTVNDLLLADASEAKAGEDPTPHGSLPTAAASESPSQAAVLKQRDGASSPASISPPPATPATPQPPMRGASASKQPPAGLVVAAASPSPTAKKEAAAEDKGVSAVSPVKEAQLCTPKQMLLQISITGFSKPAQRKKATPKRKSVASHKEGPLPLRQRVLSVPASLQQPTEAPQFVRQRSKDLPFTQHATAATAASHTSAAATTAAVHTSAAELLAPSNGSSGPTKVVVKALPPANVAKRALAVAGNRENPPRVPKESPTREALGIQKAQGKPEPMLPPKPPAPAPDAAPADQWFDQRMRDLCAMENYLHQHRMEDDKALETYDARRHKEKQHCESATPGVRAASKPSAARHCSPETKLAGLIQSPGVLVMTPPRHRHLREDIPAPPAVSAAQQRQLRQQRPGAPSPFARQVSYARQASRPACASESRQSSLSSTYNGRQASNARARPHMSLEEQLKNEEGRVMARQKREAERQRMKELISAQRAAAKKRKRKTKKEDAVDVQIVLPDHLRCTPNCAVPAD
ncbi:protein kinase, putative [Leishmania tarentolae]|uniref:non-specific serine/threonine protein kinase n=1 Tax=Leishmania tarentolae TaxID=5689 RepID=A0A640KA67_LEITA|nr:protein kinase, putative [Leishmania tarentolae]